jgi:hypothetical protein
VVTPVGEIGRQLGAPSVCLHRAVLQREMFGKLEQGIVHLNSPCVRVEQDSHRVTAYFSNGRSEDGAVLVGADGPRSIVRASLFGSRPPRYLGHTCYRGIVAFPVSILPAGYAFESWGPGRRFGAIRLDPERVYWFANVSAAPGEFDPSPGRTLQAEFGNWHKPIPEINRGKALVPYPMTKSKLRHIPSSCQKAQAETNPARGRGATLFASSRTWSGARPSNSRIRILALCNCDFEFPTEQCRSSAIS